MRLTPPPKLSRDRRLQTAAAYNTVFRRGCKSQDALFTIFAAPNPVSHARLGLAVSRKAAAKAVARNRIKRQARESFRHHQRQLAGLDVVAVARPGAATSDNRALRVSLERHWQKISKCRDS